VVVGPDGTIATTGQTSNGGVTILRLLANGTPDPTFGTNGVATIAKPGDMFPRGWRIIVEPGGGYVVAGTGSNPPPLMLSRFLPGGLPDATFGTGGLVSSGPSDLLGVVRDAGAGYVVLERTGPAVFPNPQTSQLQRFDALGVLDGGFGTSGAAVIPYTGAIDLARQPDGKLVVAGRVVFEVDVDVQAWVARFDPAGAPDPSFGTNGLVTTPVPGGLVDVQAMALMADGRIVIAAQGNGGDLLLRYLDDGTLDPGFGTAGIAGAPSVGFMTSMAVQADGRIVTAGVTNGLGHHRIGDQGVDQTAQFHELYFPWVASRPSVSRHSTASAVRSTANGRSLRSAEENSLRTKSAGACRPGGRPTPNRTR